MVSNRHFRITFVFLLSLLLVACGFQLRGTQRTAGSSLSSLQLFPQEGDYLFTNTMKGVLQDANIELNGVSLNKLEILDSRDHKRTASYSSRAKSAEYELIKVITIQFTHDKDTLIPPTKMESRRSYLYRETATVGKAEEESLLKDEMNRDLAQRILLAIQHALEQMHSANAVSEENSP